jgi:hypothetical protein
MVMEYIKPTLTLAGSAQALVLGSTFGNGDSSTPTAASTLPMLLGLGLDD